MMELMGTPKPNPRIKKGNRDPIKVVEEAFRVGDTRFQYFVVENGRLQKGNRHEVVRRILRALWRCRVGVGG